MIEAELAMTNMDDLLNQATVFNYLLKCGVFDEKQTANSEMDETST